MVSRSSVGIFSLVIIPSIYNFSQALNNPKIPDAVTVDVLPILGLTVSPLVAVLVLLQYTKYLDQNVIQDHKALRNILDLLKDTDKKMSARRQAYKGFSALLKSHSSSEELAAYIPTKKLSGREMHLKVEEGYVEHQLAADMMKRMEATKDPIVWSAHANVLAENVEHHLKEEERDLLPLIRKSVSEKKNLAMLKKYKSLRRQTQKFVTAKNAGVLK